MDVNLVKPIHAAVKSSGDRLKSEFGVNSFHPMYLFDSGRRAAQIDNAGQKRSPSCVTKLGVSVGCVE